MREQRKKAERLIDIWCDHIYGAAGGKDAGWHQPSVLQLLITYAGDIPAGTGFDQADLKMISEIRYVKEKHPKAALAASVMAKLSLHQQMVLLVRSRLRGVVCAQTDSPFIEPQMASAIGMSWEQWNIHKKAGLKQVEASI